MSLLKIALIGCDHHTSHAAQYYSQHAQCELHAIIDTKINTATDMAAPYESCKALNDYTSVLGCVDAIHIASNIHNPYEIANDFLKQKASVLLTSLYALNAEELEELLTLAEAQQCRLAISGINPYKTDLIDLQQRYSKPLFIEARSFQGMQYCESTAATLSHQLFESLYIIASLTSSNIASIHSIASPIFSEKNDIAQLHINLEKDQESDENACVISVALSRISTQIEHQLRIFEHHAYSRIDFLAQSIHHYKKNTQVDPDADHGLQILSSENHLQSHSAIEEDWHQFIQTWQQADNHSSYIAQRALAWQTSIEQHIENP